MSFGENVSFYRKKLKITQEDLAERLYVSRQTVSRWETDSTVPDVDTLLRLCDIFGCDMDTLVRKCALEAENPPQVADASKHTEHMKNYALIASLGICALMLAFAVFILCWSLEGGTWIGIFALVVLLAIAVTLFVINGVYDEEYRKKFPVAPVYTQAEIDAGKKPSAIRLVTGVALVGAALLFAFLTVSKLGGVALFIALLIGTVAAFLISYNSHFNARFDHFTYDKQCAERGFDKDGSTKSTGETVADSVNTVVVVGGFLAFLFFGFIDMWHPGWIIIPVSIVIGAIFHVNTLPSLKKDDDAKK